jgi:dTDP-4-dehydrorhamnose reductase
VKKKIVVTGGSGRFGILLKKAKSKYQVLFPKKNSFNIKNIAQMRDYIKKNSPEYLIHLAGLSRPMSMHETNISDSIDLNIIGTANITKICSEMNVKLIYFSTNYVYPGIRGNYKEKDPVYPVNNYAWSKLGGECSVKLYKNSLILRVCMTEFPFVHDEAFADFVNSFIYHKDAIKILFKVLDKQGVLNLGGKKQTVYNFAKVKKPKIKKIFLKDFKNINMPKNSSLNLKKLKMALKNK